MAFKLSERSLKELEGVHPSLVAVVRRAIELTTQDFTVTDGARTQAQQDELYAQGRTKPGNVVTWTRNSKHIGGRAVDLAAYINGKITWEPLSAFHSIAAAMKQAAKELGVPIEWGGDWQKTKDYPHFQLKDGWEPTGKPVQPQSPPPASQTPPKRTPAVEAPWWRRLFDLILAMWRRK